MSKQALQLLNMDIRNNSTKNIKVKGMKTKGMTNLIKHGELSNFEELINIPQIGKATIEKLKKQYNERAHNMNKHNSLSIKQHEE